jgi:hypothetical protein
MKRIVVTGPTVEETVTLPGGSLTAEQVAQAICEQTGMTARVVGVEERRRRWHEIWDRPQYAWGPDAADPDQRVYVQLQPPPYPDEPVVEIVS